MRACLLEDLSRSPPFLSFSHIRLVHPLSLFKNESSDIDFQCIRAGMLEDLSKAPEGSVFVLHTVTCTCTSIHARTNARTHARTHARTQHTHIHARAHTHTQVAHNPSGVDPTQEQWKKIADLCESKKAIPIFDTAYQGYASGDLDKDAFSVPLVFLLSLSVSLSLFLLSFSLSLFLSLSLSLAVYTHSLCVMLSGALLCARARHGADGDAVVQQELRPVRRAHW